MSPGSCVPLHSLLSLPQQSTGQFRTADSSQRPDRVGGEYLVSSEVQLNTIPSHNNPLSMNSGKHIIIQLLRIILPTSGEMMLGILRRVHDIQKASANNDRMPNHGLLALKTSITKTDTRKTRVWALDKKLVLNFKVMAITFPNHKNASARTIGANAARTAGQPLDGSYMMLEQPQAARSTYQLYKITNGADFVLVAHYPKFYLHLLLSAMCGICCRGQVRVYMPLRCPDLLSSQPQTTQNRGPTPEDTTRSVPFDCSVPSLNASLTFVTTAIMTLQQDYQAILGGHAYLLTP